MVFFQTVIVIKEKFLAEWFTVQHNNIEIFTPTVTKNII